MTVIKTVSFRIKQGSTINLFLSDKCKRIQIYFKMGDKYVEATLVKINVFKWAKLFKRRLKVCSR